MASRNRRHQIPPTTDSTSGTGNNQVRNSIARYDMSLPQNWTVAQLRAELNRHNISYNKTDKKTKLIQLCRDNGVLMGHQHGEQESLNINTGDNMLVSLTKTVAELQKTVLNLSGTVNKLVQKDSSEASLSATNDPVISEPTASSSAEISSPFIAELAGQDFIEASTSATGVRTKFGYSAESLPFIETVHPTLRKQIIEGKDVNLASLLIPYYTGQHSDPSATSKDKPDPRLNHSLTLTQFIQAFGIYKNIMCEIYPARRLELDLYERDIVDMGTRYNGKGFYEYHKAFSAQAAAHLKYSNKKVDWSVRNNKLFASIFVNQPANICFLCNSSLHMTSFCPNQLNRGKSHNSPGYFNASSIDIRGRARVLFNGQEICNNFNSGRGCNNTRCKNVHVCLSCKKEHSQQSCPDAKNSIAVRINNQK